MVRRDLPRDLSNSPVDLFREMETNREAAILLTLSRKIRIRRILSLWGNPSSKMFPPSGWDSYFLDLQQSLRHGGTPIQSSKNIQQNWREDCERVSEISRAAEQPGRFLGSDTIKRKRDIRDLLKNDSQAFMKFWAKKKNQQNQQTKNKNLHCRALLNNQKTGHIDLTFLRSLSGAAVVQ